MVAVAAFSLVARPATALLAANRFAGLSCRGQLAPMTPERRDPRKPMTRDVAARGARIRFVEAGSGPPLVLVHDYLASRLAWEDVLPLLAENFHVIVPDLPGFGESEKPSPSRYRYDFEGFSESLVGLVAALGAGSVFT